MFSKIHICDALRDLVAFAQFKKQICTTLLKLTLLHGCFSRFLNCTNVTKSGNASYMEAAENTLRFYFLRFIYQDK